MENENEVRITTYDRLLRAWENSMELTRDFEMYSKIIDDHEEIRKTFGEFAEDEGVHSAKLRELLVEFRKSHGDRF